MSNTNFFFALNIIACSNDYTKQQFTSTYRYAHRNNDSYEKMLAFNHILSSQRITIERAFGILIRRWGILWRPIAYSLNKVAKIVRVCAMLHNVCVDRWLRKNPVRYKKEGQMWPEEAGEWGEDDLCPDDEEIISRLHNNYTEERSVESSLRSLLMENIYDSGLRAGQDTDFHPMINI